MNTKIAILAALTTLLALPARTVKQEQTTDAPGYVFTQADGRPAHSVVAAEASYKSVEVTQEGKEFSESEIRIPIGGKVTFVNNDDVSHNVYCQSADFKFNTGSQTPGTRNTVEFTEAGKFLVRCAVHLNMKLKVIVE